MERQQDYVLRSVEERNIRFIRLWFTDVLGQLKSIAIVPGELENAFEEGMTFDGSSIDGFSRVQESDMLLQPDPNTFELLPWRGDDAPVARMFCDVTTLDGAPFAGDPRHVLRRRTILGLESIGIPVRYSHHEDSPSQHEIDLRYTDALTMADNVMTFKLVVKEIALERGVHASFMPKPLAGVQGSGMHTHLSLFEGDVNAFHDPGDEAHLSKVAKGFLAGLLHHAREITAITNQWVNS